MSALLVRFARLQQLRYEAARRAWRADNPIIPAESVAARKPTEKPNE